MPFDLSFSPTVLLAMWAGGIALAVAFVAHWRVVGAGFLWTAAGAVVLAGIGPVASGSWAQVAVAATVVAAVLAKRPAAATVAFAVAGVGFVVHAMTNSALNPALTISGAVALGGTTAEMLLGHWYLVDPKLPRWALRRLDSAGIAGLAADAIIVIALGALAGGAVLGWVLIGLVLMSVLMMLGVWFSLKETGYEGVMAATGLSYLSVLTALGAVAVGRFLVG
jgi:hypothetical protein